MKTITGVEADKLFNEKWFEDYTTKVKVYDEKVTTANFLEEFETEGEEEFIIFNNGLSSTTIDLSEGLCSIYGVNGNVETEKLLIGDSILVINGTLKVKEFIFMTETQGVLEINNQQFDGHNLEILKNIDCPLVILFDRDLEGMCIFRKVGEEFVKVLAEELIDDLVDEGEIDQYAIGDIIAESQAIFK